jgi:hypothetical protein
VENLEPGQSITVNVPSIGINNESKDVLTVSYTWGKTGYVMKLSLDEEPRRLEDVIKRIERKVNNTLGSISGSLELIRRLEIYSETIGLTDRLDIDERGINDSFILDNKNNSELGSNKGNPLGDRRDNWSDKIDV